MDIGHCRQHRLREEVGHRLAERFFLRLRVVDFRLDHLLLRHFRHLRQGDQQPLQRGRRQGQVFLLPVQAGGKIAHGHCGIVDFDVDVMQCDAAEGDRIRGGEIQRPAVFFLDRRGGRHLLRIDSDVNIAQRDVVHAQAAVPQAAQPDAEVKLAGGDRHAGLLVANIIEG